jgi:hypothetical protein
MIRKVTIPLALLFCSVIGVLAADEKSPDTTGETPARGPISVLKRTWGSTVDGIGSAGKFLVNSVTGVFSGNSKPSRASKLSVSINLPSASISLAKDRQIAAVLVLSNLGKRTQVLAFPSTKRVEAVLRDNSGKILARAFEDRQFKDEEGVITINPGESLEFECGIPSRDLSAGSTYTLEASIVNQEGLITRKPISVLP